MNKRSLLIFFFSFFAIAHRLWFKQSVIREMLDIIMRWCLFRHTKRVMKSASTVTKGESLSCEQNKIYMTSFQSAKPARCIHSEDGLIARTFKIPNGDLITVLLCECINMIRYTCTLMTYI